MNKKLVALKFSRARNATLRPILLVTMRCFGITGSLTAQRTGSLIRPLMSISRNDVKKLCQFWALPIYPDATNQELAFSRNRIRKQIFPALKVTLNPQVDNVLSQSAEILLAERLHADLLTLKLLRASQSAAGVKSHQQAASSTLLRPCNTSVALALITMRASVGMQGLRTPEISKAVWLSFYKKGQKEIIGKTCHKQKRCAGLLFQRSKCFFLPQVGRLFAHLSPIQRNTLSKMPLPIRRTTLGYQRFFFN